MNLPPMKFDQVKYTVIESPIGPLLATARGAELSGLHMESHRRGPQPSEGWRRDDRPFVRCSEQLAAYFAGELARFDLPLSLAGTEFQRRVWQALRAIPLGATVTYAQLAAHIDAPSAVRAVGAAVGRNPVSIIVPCHRVVGSDGSLRGFAGGLERKRWLLEHERQVETRQTSKAQQQSSSFSCAGSRSQPLLVQ